MIVERAEKWKPVEGIVTPTARALVKENHEGLTVVLKFSEIVNGPQCDLLINCGRVPAYSVYGEFVHPWNGPATDYPTLAGDWDDYTYPLLQIQDSEWMNSLAERLIPDTALVHYRFVTLDQIVDVLCTKLPEVGWIKAAET
jgi:hypothetical protein